FFQAEDGIRDRNVTGVQTCALPICHSSWPRVAPRLQPPTRKLGRAGLSPRPEGAAALAYLVLLRMEVAAFHPSVVKPRTRLCGRSEERRVGEGWWWRGWTTGRSQHR